MKHSHQLCKLLILRGGTGGFACRSGFWHLPPRTAGLFVIVACLVTLACTQDPARSVKIITSPPVKIIASPPLPISSITVPSGAPAPNSHLEFCPPPDEDSPGPSHLIAKGPCGFEHRGAVRCEALRDDFIAAFTRKAKDGATLVVFLNVENYHGPGSYDGAQMFETVQSGTNTYRWSSDNVHATVGRGAAFVTLPETRLEEEPMLVNCTGSIGPATNYQYHCGGRSSGKMAVDRTGEIVSGTLQCKAE